MKSIRFLQYFLIAYSLWLRLSDYFGLRSIVGEDRKLVPIQEVLKNERVVAQFSYVQQSLCMMLFHRRLTM